MLASARYRSRFCTGLASISYCLAKLQAKVRIRFGDGRRNLWRVGDASNSEITNRNKWQPVPPDSAGEAMMNVACNKHVKSNTPHNPLAARCGNLRSSAGHCEQSPLNCV